VIYVSSWYSITIYYKSTTWVWISFSIRVVHSMVRERKPNRTEPNPKNSLLEPNRTSCVAPQTKANCFKVWFTGLLCFWMEPVLKLMNWTAYIYILNCAKLNQTIKNCPTDVSWDNLLNWIGSIFIIIRESSTLNAHSSVNN
jgi:RNA polymerase subunit RPABC4/transcription elongation factor Spt4